MLHTEKFLSTKTDEFMQKCLLNPGTWIHFTKDNCGLARGEIYSRVKQMLRLMSIQFARDDEFPQGKMDYGHGYKIKVIQQAKPQQDSRESHQARAVRQGDSDQL